MNITSLYRELSFGELSGLSMGVDSSGTVPEEQQERIIHFANEGLLKLYSRFMLREGNVVLATFDHITNYHFIKKFTASRADETGEPFPYLMDIYGERFDGDVIKIMDVYNNKGHKVPVNDAESHHSFFTPSNLILQVPRPVTGEFFSVTYQAKHLPLDHQDDESEIDLPAVLIPALRAYIGSKIFAPMLTQEAVARAEMLNQMYETICQECLDQDLVNTSVSQTSAKFEKRGWI